MFSLSLFDPRSRQSNISTSGEERSKYTLPRQNKISQMPFPWPLANKDNEIPTPCPAFPPPPPPGMTLIGASDEIIPLPKRQN